jgi:hypothetical protein
MNITLILIIHISKCVERIELRDFEVSLVIPTIFLSFLSNISGCAMRMRYDSLDCKIIRLLQVLDY